MNLKTLFSKSIIKSDFKRYWWISALFTLLIALNYTFMLFLDILGMTAVYTDHKIYINVNDFAIVIMGIIFGGILGSLLFSYLQKGKNVTFFHALPCSRTTLYFSHIFTGLVMFVVPLVINLIASFLIVKGFDAENLISNKNLYQCFHIALIYGITFFCMASFVSTFMGNTFASFMFTYVFYFLPLGIEVFFKGFASEMLHGFYISNADLITLEAYFFNDPCTPLHIITYSILCIAFLGAGILIYKKRNLENHSEIVSFPKLKFVFIIGSGLVFGAIGYAYFLAINTDMYQTALTFIPFGLIGIIISAMISAKSFKVPKLYKPVGMFLALVFVLFLVFDLDITGFEKRVPKEDDVESIVYEYAGYYYLDNARMHIPHTDAYNSAYVKNGFVYYQDQYTPLAVNRETIKKICDFHKTLASSPKPQYSNNDIVITYNLKNGKTLKRSYPVGEIHNKTVSDIANTELKSLYMPILRNQERNYQELTLRRKSDMEPIKAFVSKEEMSALCDALKKDIESTDAWTLLYSQDNEYIITLNYNQKVITSDTYEALDVSSEENYAIFPGYTNTLAILEEYGY